jgi:hypothetical protein
VHRGTNREVARPTRARTTPEQLRGKPQQTASRAADRSWRGNSAAPSTRAQMCTTGLLRRTLLVRCPRARRYEGREGRAVGTDPPRCSLLLTATLRAWSANAGDRSLRHRRAPPRSCRRRPPACPECRRRPVGREGRDVGRGRRCDGREAVEVAAELCPDVVLMDVSMPNMSGLEATHVLTQQRGSMRVPMLGADERRRPTWPACVQARRPPTDGAVGRANHRSGPLVSFRRRAPGPR